MKSVLKKPSLSIELIMMLIVFLLSSCVSTLHVYEGSKKVNGIPFYTQKGIIKQQTQYLFKWKVVSLVKVEDGNEKKETIIITRKVPLNHDLFPIESQMKGMAMNDESKIFDDIKKIDSVKIPSAKDVELIYNNWSPSMIIDYETKYYLNSKTPWFGTSSLTQKLNEQGIITEASSTTDSQIDELITSVGGIVTGLASSASSIKVAKIQAEEVLSDKAAFDPQFNLEIMDDKLKLGISYKLIVEEKGYLYTFSKIICNGSCKEDVSITSIPFDMKNGNYTRIDWPVKITETKIKDKPTIGISGSIILPEKKTEGSK